MKANRRRLKLPLQADLATEAPPKPAAAARFPARQENIVKAKKSIELLNKAVADELQAVHQYMYWHFHLDDQGFAPLSAMFRRIAIMEMDQTRISPEASSG